MALTVWTLPSGRSLGTFQEGTELDLELPVSGDSGVSYSVISGRLPGGLNIIGNNIKGIPFETIQDQISTFCIRASKNGEIADRTFTITITNTNGPEFVTPAGDLPAGPNQQYYVLGNSYADFQLEVIDENIAAGAVLKFFIESNSGRLPPGLSLTEDGRIVGFVQPALSITIEAGDGTYDNSYYDAVAFDFAIVSSNGYDSYLYDDVFFDFNVASQLTTQLNTRYQFTVTVTDGNNSARRTYSIFVVGDNFFTADNTLLNNDTDWTADVTAVIAPVWKTPANLGSYRSNNYITVPLETYDRENVTFTLEQVNSEIISVISTPNFLPETFVTQTIGSNNRLVVFEVITAGFEENMPVFFSALNLTATATETTTDDFITLSSVDGISTGMPITFSGPGFGNIVQTILYYVSEVNVITSQIKISETYGGPHKNLVTATGNMQAVINGSFGGLLVNTVYYIKEIIDNSHITISETPGGPEIDVANAYGTIFIKNVDNRKTFNFIKVRDTTTVPTVGKKLTFNNRFIGASGNVYTISAVENLGVNSYRLTITTPLADNLDDGVVFTIGDASELPPGMFFDQNYSEIAGVVPYQPSITKTYRFTIAARRLGLNDEFATRTRIFTIRILGTIDSVINWVTPSNLGVIEANYVSNLYVNALSTVQNSVVVYTLVDGSLPTGLELDPSGEIIGKANQFPNPTSGELGLTEFDGGEATFDKNVIPQLTNDTTFDRSYTFTVRASDQYGYNATERTFTLSVVTPNSILYSNIKVKPYLKLEERSLYNEFITNSKIFTPSSIYRPNDPNFGVQKTLEMIIYAGIETAEAAKYVGAIGLNHKKKQFYFGDVKNAIAYIPETKIPVYEVVYVEMIDPLTHSNSELPLSIKNQSLANQIITADNSIINQNQAIFNGTITVDSTGYETSNPRSTTYYPNSVSNWRKRIKSVGLDEQNYLPLWMRSIQPGTKSPSGFKLAVPLCYCKIGTSADIVANIKNLNFNFKNLNYTVDRYIIDAVDGYSSDKYLVFRNDRITV